MIHVKEPHYFAGFGVFFKRFASALGADRGETTKSGGPATGYLKLG
jgi:hypothetical protein